LESHLDIFNQLTSETLNQVFGENAKDYLQLKVLTSKVKAKSVLFEKLECNQTPAPASISTFPLASTSSSISTFQPASTLTSTSGSRSVDNFEDMLDENDDLNEFLKLNEEERDSWGASNNISNTDFNGECTVGVIRNHLVSYISSSSCKDMFFIN